MGLHDRDDLIRRAREAARMAHAPYSKFRVGAAVVANGKVFTGANVENSSFGLTLCAERSALAAAITSGATDVTHVAVSCIDADKKIGTKQLMPCGACRQWLVELAPRATIVVDGIDRTFAVGDLLPLPFSI